MIERGCRARLSAKSFQSLWHLGQVVGKKFKCDKPAEGEILGLVDNTHAAAAQRFEDSIVRDGLADHWANYANLTHGKLVTVRWNTVVDVGEWSVSRIGALLIGIEKPLEVHLEFEIVAAGSLNECCAVLCGFFPGGMEQRLQTLPEFRSHVRG